MKHTGREAKGRHCSCSPRGYTLIEVLIVVTVLGIMGAMVIPQVASADSLRTRAAVRAVIADITYIQSDAMAFQRGRAMVFDVATNTTLGLEVNGPVLDIENDVLFEPTRASGRLELNLADATFGLSRLGSVDIDGGNVLIFDEMGAPVTTPQGNAPSTGGLIVIDGPVDSYWLRIDGFTGHVTSGRVEPEDPEL
ncbi:MAG: prepilin-type N-terminal cleavage/methylation domain-containing protein [Phycisphaerales bacterium]|nr:prepilin-type N-terminal cleavage/methylation domain-containing protein [Phycisphaerales bacterium]